MEVMEMKSDTFSMYLEAIEPLTAGERLICMSDNDYPHIKMNERRKLHKAIYFKSNPFKTYPKMTMDEFFGKPKVKQDGQ